MQGGGSCRFSKLLLFLGTLLVALAVALFQFHRVLQDLLNAQNLPYPSWTQMQWLAAHHPAAGRLHPPLDAPLGRENNQRMDALQEQVQGLLREAMAYREEMEDLKGRVSELEAEIKRGAYREEITKEFQSRLVRLERECKQGLSAAPPDANLSQEASSLQFSPLKDKSAQERGNSHVHHYFLSVLKGRGRVEGPPELFAFPGDANSQQQRRLLCLRGSSTSDGAQNSYALAYKEEVPTGARLVPGITLISDTFWDFTNPWHSMFNLLQFVYWRIDSACSHAHNLLLFHQGELRTAMGTWIKSILQASGLPSVAASLNELPSGDSHDSKSAGQPPTVCFQQAIVSRSGIGGMKRPLLSRMFKEAQCQARRACNIHVGEDGAEETGFNSSGRRRVNVTLLVRKGARGFVDEGAWQRVVRERCEAAPNCSWSIMYVANLTFCQQVEAMSHTNILISAHGAQLANIIFMPPGGSVMEMFPFGWLEMAGHGQYIYRNLASWVGLHHEGYWRDPSTPPCPDPSNAGACFTHYKDQPLGINATHIETWLADVIERYQNASLSSIDYAKSEKPLNSIHQNICECRSRQ